MRLDDYDSSNEVGDQRGQSFGGGGGMGGGAFGLIFGLVASRFGIGGIIVLALGAMLLGMNPLAILGGGGGVAPTAQQTALGGDAGARACEVDAESKFSCNVLASTRQTWTAILAESGQRYSPAGLIFYDRTGQSGCGVAQSAMGPFYCPSDNRIYLDTRFYQELRQRFGAAGDFAQAYVIAHEVGHHLQQLSGTLDRARRVQASVGEAAGNAEQVKVELQADCYAGVWAARNRDRLEPGDVEEGLRAAEAIGDDTLQQASQGRVAPESFTHGSAAQRMAALRQGLETGDPAACGFS